MIQCLLISDDGQVTRGGEELIAQHQANSESRLWVNFNHHEQENEASWLEKLGCHPLAILDVQRKRHPPKIEDFQDQLFILFKGFVNHDDSIRFEHIQVGMFISERVLITRHQKSFQLLEQFFNGDGEKWLRRGPFQLAVKIFHESNGGYLQELFRFEETLDKIEHRFIAHANDHMMRNLTHYRAQLIKLIRTFRYHVNIGETLSDFIEDDDIPLVASTDRHTITDLTERLNRLLSLTQLYYDICGDLINGYLSITSHLLNNTMRILTVITAIFVPLGFLAGLYGMNFKYMPELEFESGYFVLLAVMGTVAVTLLSLFKYKKWL